MSEVADHYIGAEIMLPRWDQMGRGNENPILDTRVYQVDYAGNEVTELTNDVIAVCPVWCRWE